MREGLVNKEVLRREAGSGWADILHVSEVIEQESIRTKHQHNGAETYKASKLRFLHMLTLLNQEALMIPGRPVWQWFWIQITTRITITHNCKGMWWIRGWTHLLWVEKKRWVHFTPVNTMEKFREDPHDKNDRTSRIFNLSLCVEMKLREDCLKY